MDATCTNDGSYDSVTYCSVCKAEISRETKIINKLGHNYSAEWTVDVAPTCTTVGSKSHHCSRCDDKADITEIPANGHSWGNWYETKAPTCTATGTDERECSICQERETRITDAPGHTNATPVVENRVDATCTKDGSYDSVTYCSVCKAEISREAKTIIKLGHDYSTEWTVNIEPTCTTVGSKSHHCTRCDDRVDVTEIPANGHSWGDWYLIEFPLCTSTGTDERECSVCHETEMRSTDAKGHTNDVPVIENKKEATCTTNGSYDSVVYCSVCQAEVSRETNTIAKLGHNEILHSGKSATCTESSWKEYVTCSRCDYTTYEVIAALGHNEIHHNGKTPTCTEYGWNAYITCSRCDYSTYQELPATGHSISNWIIDEEATYEKDGRKHKECTACGEVLEESIIPMLSHKYVSVVTAPTCTAQGYTTHTCSDCGNSYVDDYTPAIGHTFSNWTQTKAPTCTEKGSERRDCTVCDHFETRFINALGHTDATPVVENRVEASCTTNGSYDSVIYCFVCQAEIIREVKTIAKLGHNYSIEWTVDIEATCTTVGSMSHHCARCDDKSEVTEIAANGHSWSYDAMLPTCTEKGYEYKECGVCHSFEEREFDALGHNEIPHNGKVPTCTEFGWKKYVTCSRCDYSTYEELPATSHKASEWIIDEEATYEKDGRKYKECTTCGEILEESIIPMLSHKYVSVVTPPTCTERGYTTHTCSDCGNSYVDDYIPATGHNYSAEWTVDIEPTCTTAGSQSHHCVRCDVKKDVTEIPASGHTFGDWQQVKAPTCTGIGAERRYCANCDAFEKRPVDALGHSFTNYVSNNDATYTEDGTKTAKCDCCNEKNTITDEGSALGMAQKFRDEMAELSQNADAETTYGELYAVLQTYASLSAKEKEDVAKEFATLQQMINVYNAKAQTANNELAEATEIAFGPIAATSFAFLAALWFLLRKKFLV